MTRSHSARLLSTCSVALLALAPFARADIAVDERLAIGGYVAGSYRLTDPDPGASSDRFDLDAAKVLFNPRFAPASANISLYYVPGAPEDVTVLDAFITYDAGNGVTITGGKFLSWLGYEAFDLVNMSQITYANGDFLAPIPGYHSGVKVELAHPDWSGGVAVLDSVYSGPFYLKGDGELRENAGFEAYLTYKGVDRLTLFLGGAYDSKGGFEPDSIATFDLWAQYALTEYVTVAGEWVYKDVGPAARAAGIYEGYNWLAYLNVKSSASFATTLRLSGESADDGPELLRYTISPSFNLTPNLVVRAEATYTDYRSAGIDSALFLGLQSFLKF